MAPNPGSTMLQASCLGPAETFAPMEAGVGPTQRLIRIPVSALSTFLKSESGDEQGLSDVPEFA